MAGLPRHGGGGATLEELVDTMLGERVTREDVELVGPQADHKGVESYPPGRGGYR